MTMTFSPDIANSALTTEQIAKAEQYLTDTRDALVESTNSLSASQWDFKPASDCWSISEIVEHVALIEGRVPLIIGKMSEAPQPPADWEPTRVDDFILAEVPNRSTKFEAPPHVQPTHRWSGEEALKHFVESREQTIQLLWASSLRGHVIPHPILGLWDGYQWLLAAGAHGARHTEQILELRADPAFPPAASEASGTLSALCAT